MAVDLLVEQLPQVSVFHRFLRRGFPAALLPVVHPLVDAFHHVLRVGHQQHLAGTLELFQATDRAHQLHAVIGGIGFAAPEFLFNALAHQQCAPAARAGVALAGAVGEQFYAIAHANLSRKCAGPPIADRRRPKPGHARPQMKSVYYGSMLRRLTLAIGKGINLPIGSRRS
ncbi:hypothetical protein D9M71_654490 [compost metagenome]